MKHINRLVLLLMAGWFVAAQAQDKPHDYARWEKEISAFERMDRTNPPPKGAVLFTGSSTIRIWKTMARDLPGQAVINRGFGGSEVVDSTYFAPRIIFPYEPRMVVLRAGGNDLANGNSVKQVFEDYKEFVDKVHAGLPSAQIVFMGWSPSVSRWRQHEKEKELNNLVEQFSRQAPYLKYIETYDISLGTDGMPRPELFLADKLHFNAEGYKLLAARVREFLAKNPPPP